MEYKDFIKPGEKVIYCPQDEDENLWYYDDCVVKIGNYRPYYTDGSPDPVPSDYEEFCMVELSDYVYGESQVHLRSLHPIIPETGEKLYNGDIVKVIGHDEDSWRYVIEADGKEKVVYDDDLEDHRQLSDLTFEELKKLREQVVLCSCYLSDYHNSLGIDLNTAYDIFEDYSMYLEDKYGEEEWEKHDTPEEFAIYVY